MELDIIQTDGNLNEVVEAIELNSENDRGTLRIIQRVEGRLWYD